MFTFVFALFVVIIGAVAPLHATILETLVTDELREMLDPFDPATLGNINNISVVIGNDTRLLFNYEDVFMINFSDIECTNLSLINPTQQVILSVKQPVTTVYAENYTVVGVLRGQNISASGKANISAINTQYTYTFKVDAVQLFPFSMCIGDGSLEIALQVESLQANYENADQLNEVINKNGPQLYELWQQAIEQNANTTAKALNDKFCHSHGPATNDDDWVLLFVLSFCFTLLSILCFFLGKFVGSNGRRKEELLVKVDTEY